MLWAGRGRCVWMCQLCGCCCSATVLQEAHQKQQLRHLFFTLAHISSTRWLHTLTLVHTCTHVHSHKQTRKQDPSAIQAAHAGVPLPEAFNAMAFLSSVGKGKPIAGNYMRLRGCVCVS